MERGGGGREGSVDIQRWMGRWREVKGLIGR